MTDPRATSSDASSARTPGVQAVIFDWGGTITPWHTVDLREQWQVFARGMGAIACSLNDTASAVLTAEDEAWRRGRTEGTSARLDDILQTAGLDPAHPATQAGLAAYREFWEPHTFTHPNIPEIWEWLRDNGIRVGVLSNTIWSRDYHRDIFERDGVLHLVDGGLSDNLGVRAIIESLEEIEASSVLRQSTRINRIRRVVVLVVTLSLA